MARHKKQPDAPAAEDLKPAAPEAQQPDAPAAEGLVSMVRRADWEGRGARAANVHPLEVENYKAGGWIVEE